MHSTMRAITLEEFDRLAIRQDVEWRRSPESLRPHAAAGMIDVEEVRGYLQHCRVIHDHAIVGTFHEVTA